MWVALPLELVDWMATHFDGVLVQYLHYIDPYASVLLPHSVVLKAVEELNTISTALNGNIASTLPEVVDIFGAYGVSGAITTVSELRDFFEFAAHNPCKVISIGD
jgi:hypothetical protein